CIKNVQGGAEYLFGAKIRFREGEVSQGYAVINVEYSTTTDCSFGTLFGSDGPPVFDAATNRGTWHALRVGTKAAPVVTPAGTKSIWVEVFVVLKQGSQLTLNIDDYFAAPATTPFCGGLPATIIGTNLPDVINGTAGGDVIVGRGGADQIDGKGGN